MLDFTTITREFGSLVDRRRELSTLLASVFAGLGIFLQNVLNDSLPPALRSVGDHGFAFYSLILMVSSLILSLRLARLHGGMVLNGMLYARLMQQQDFTRKGDPERSGRHNYTGASFLQFVLVDLIAGFSAAILALALHAPRLATLGAGCVVFVVWMALYFRFHHRARRFAREKIAQERCGPFTREDWEAHTSSSLESTNKDLLACLGFVGLMMFSALETISGLGQRTIHGGPELTGDDIQVLAPAIYTSLMVATCFFQMVVYLRLRVAIGRFSLDLDPTDRPFRPLRLTDSFLGYVLLAFLFAVSLHLLLLVAVPDWSSDWRWPLAIDAAALVLAILAEPVTLILAGRRHTPAPAAKSTVAPPSTEVAPS